MKKAILVVSHGTTFAQTRKKTLDAIEDKIRKSFPQYEVRRGYTGQSVIKKLKTRDNIHVPTPRQALEQLKDENYTQLIVQPLYLIPGSEYDSIKKLITLYKDKGLFEKISLGRPALYFKGGTDLPDDYEIFIQAIKDHISKDRNFLLMGHGTSHPANACYSCLQQVLIDKGYRNVYIGNVEAYPQLDLMINRLSHDRVDQLILKPLMLVSGHHVKKDMVGDHKDSWKNQLARQGIQLEIDQSSLGEISDFQDIYLQHVEDAIKGLYL